MDGASGTDSSGSILAAAVATPKLTCRLPLCRATAEKCVLPAAVIALPRSWSRHEADAPRLQTTCAAPATLATSSVSVALTGSSSSPRRTDSTRGGCRLWATPSPGAPDTAAAASDPPPCLQQQVSTEMLGMLYLVGTERQLLCRCQRVGLCPGGWAAWPLEPGDEPFSSSSAGQQAALRAASPMGHLLHQWTGVGEKEGQQFA